MPAHETVSSWLKGVGASLVVAAGVIAAPVLDGAYGRGKSLRTGVLALAAAAAGLGWILLATGLSWHPESQLAWRSVAVWVALALVAASAATAFWYRLGELDLPAAVGALYAAAWALLAAAVAVVRRGGNVEVDPANLLLGMGAAVLVPAGTLLVQPWERAKCVTEGPSQAMVMAGWWLLTQTRS